MPYPEPGAGMLRRREFVGLLTAAVTWPPAVLGQKSALPVIGFLHPGSSAGWAAMIAAFEQGLKQAGFVANNNVAIEHHWAENQASRLRELTADLVRRQVAIIVTVSDVPTLVAK